MSAPAPYLSVHLEELRRRVLVSFAAIVVASGVAYFFSDRLVHLFMKPLLAAYPSLARLVYTNLTEAFVSYLKMALVVGVIGAFPVLCFEIWMFIAPGLHRHEKKVALQVVGWGSLLFAAGVFFAYFVALPRVLGFLLSFAGPSLTPYPKLGAYLTFVARACLAFGLAFEMPFLMVMAVRSGLVSRDYFVRKRKFSYLGIAAVAFLLAAGDPLSTLMLALPLCGLYEAGILIGRLFPGRQQPQEHTPD